MVAHATKKTPELADESFNLSKARLVRIGPRRHSRLSLRSLREAAGLTQKEVARKSGLAQPEVSKLETAESLDDRQLSTLRRYCAAMGDELELVTVSKLGHRIGIAPPARRLTAAEAADSANEPRALEARPSWAQVFALLGGAWMAHPSRDSADRHAWTLIWAGLKHFGAPVDYAGDFSEVSNERAYKALLGGDKRRRSRATLRYVDAALDGARHAGVTKFDELARIMCEFTGKPIAEAPELANMLANAYEPKKQGKLPAGKFSRAQIVAWLTGEKWERTRAAAIGRGNARA